MYEINHPLSTFRTRTNTSHEVMTIFKRGGDGSVKVAVCRTLGESARPHGAAEKVAMLEKPGDVGNRLNK